MQVKGEEYRQFWVVVLQELMKGGTTQGPLRPKVQSRIVGPHSLGMDKGRYVDRLVRERDREGWEEGRPKVVGDGAGEVVGDGISAVCVCVCVCVVCVCVCVCVSVMSVLRHAC